MEPTRINRSTTDVFADHDRSRQAESLLSPSHQETDIIGKLRNRQPRRLGEDQHWSLYLQILLSIFPILFIALASTAITLDQKPTSPTGKMAERAIFLSPTIFPIVFAAIVGKFSKKLGLFLAERGTKLGTLERLIGSQSLFSVIEKQLLLPGQYLLGFLMVACWALSPVGGQLALRLLETTPQPTSFNSTVRYLPIAAYRLSTMGDVNKEDLWQSYGPMFMTSLITSRAQKNSSQDLYGNVKIPILDRIVPRSSMDTGVWTTIDQSHEIPYCSLLGIPVVGIPSTGNLTFNIVSRYFNIDCTTPTSEDHSEVFINKEPDGSWTAAYYIRNKGGSFFIETPFFYPGNYTGSWMFNFTSINANVPFYVSNTTCSMSPQDVESQIACIDQSCQVTAMRYLPKETNLLWALYINFIKPSLELLPLSSIGALSHGPIYFSSLTELWLQNPYANYGLTSFQDSVMPSVNLSTMTGPTFSQNFEVLYNTYWQSTFGSKYLFGNLSTSDMSIYNDIGHYNATVVSEHSQPTIDFNTSQVTIRNFDGEQYICNKMFAAFLIAISSILFFTSMASLVLGTMTLAPDILGYVSSSTRDNPFALYDEASHLDGLDRAKALNDMKVAIGDAEAECEAGYIAFGATGNVVRLQKNRLYH